MIIHFIKDEKTVDQVIANFETAAPGRNVFLNLRGKKEKKDFVHIKNTERVTPFTIGVDNINTFISKLAAVDGIVLHGLYSIFAREILKISSSLPKIYWVMMGFDIYSLPKIEPTIYGLKATEYLSGIKKKAVKLDLRWLKRVLTGTNDPYKFILKSHNIISGCVSYVKEDYDVLQKYYPNKYQFIDTSFYSISQFVGQEFVDKTVSGNNVIIGNSNTVECNHLDAIELLSKYKVGDRKFYVPLSYGSDLNYRNKVEQDGLEKLGNGFTSLKDFISKQEYIQILLSCSVGIFYHYRQQAMGNIIPMLWLGARIYLSEKNPVYAYLKRLGLHVYILDKDFDQYQYTPLEEQLAKHNRSVLLSEFNEERVKVDFKKLVDSLTKA